MEVIWSASRDTDRLTCRADWSEAPFRLTLEDGDGPVREAGFGTPVALRREAERWLGLVLGFGWTQES
jgi:hypothetical protein